MGFTIIVVINVVVGKCLSEQVVPRIIVDVSRRRHMHERFSIDGGRPLGSLHPRRCPLGHAFSAIRGHIPGLWEQVGGLLWKNPGKKKKGEATGPGKGGKSLDLNPGGKGRGGFYSKNGGSQGEKNFFFPQRARGRGKNAENIRGGVFFPQKKNLV
eukprot:FR742375.1.p2 GENE.FR742375.1~~FR742375.1.p2  ORF type:complete len:156 (+),score=45.32 FR742375.1:600-1067(+)